MRGMVIRQATMLLTVTPGDLVSPGQPIQGIKPIVDQALAHLSPTFAQMYAAGRRSSIPPEHLL